MRISDRVANTPPSGIRRFFELVEEKEDVISLSVGEPDFAAPWAAREAGIDSLERGRTSYTTNRGRRDLRTAIADHVRRYDLEYDPEREILVTTGVSEGMDVAMRTFLNPGDAIAIPQPTYISYPATARFAGAEVIPVETSADEDFRLSYDALDRAGAADAEALVYCYPNNPTGAVMPEADLREVADFAREHDLTVLADEIYAALTYDAEHTSIATLPGMGERTVVFNGFSKAYAMTGLRLGYAMGPPEAIEAMNRVHQYVMLSAPTTAQCAATEALRSCDDQVAEMRSAYDRRRRFVRSRFEEVGMSCAAGRGAFYVFPEIPDRDGERDDEAFAEALLESTDVAVVPGSAFGDGGAGHLRVCYAYAMDDLREALDRIAAFVREEW